MLEQYKIRKNNNFVVDVKRTISYIINNLKNPDAAKALSFEIEKTMQNRAKLPKAFKPYTYDKESKIYIYYVKVENFYAFYYINEKQKLIRFFAFIYARVSVANILKQVKASSRAYRKTT